MDTVRRTGPDPATVRAAGEGDPAALDALVAASLPLVYNIVGRALRGHADVDDVVQETLLRMVRGIGDLREPESFRSWLVAIAIRQVRDREQRRKVTLTRRITLDDAAEVPDAAADFADVTILRLGLTDQRREVAEATRWLADEDRALLALWWLEEAGELARTDLAHALGVSGPHAAVRVARMKEQLYIARVIVRALREQPACPELAAVRKEWDGTPSPLWRKRLARHVRGCSSCSARTGGLLPMERLLAGAGLVPVPAALAAKAATVPSAVASAGAVTKGAALAGTRLTVLRRIARVIRALFGGAHAGAAGGAVAATIAVVLVSVVAVQAIGRASADPGRAPGAATSARPGAAASLSPAGSPATAAQPPAPVSAGPSTSPASVPPSAPAVPATVVSARKGVSVWKFTGVGKALVQSGAGWYYTWSTAHSGITAPKGTEFVPMIWGSGSVTSSALAQAKAAGHNLLGFNEPDLSSQANMTVNQALGLWPQLEATDMTLGSPAVAYGGDTAGGWLDQFMSGAESRGYRVDFITLHWYGSDFRTGPAVSQLESYIKRVYQRYHKPIWLTEFALINFSGSGSYPSGPSQAAFITAATKMLDGLSYVKRYAWFALPADDGKPSTGLFKSGPVVTAAGKAFEAAR